MPTFSLSFATLLVPPSRQHADCRAGGSKGSYDFKMTFTPDLGQQPPGQGDKGADRPTPVDAIGPSIVTALQEQLGLKLDAQKGPVEVLVIDSAQKASAN